MRCEESRLRGGWGVRSAVSEVAAQAAAAAAAAGAATETRLVCSREVVVDFVHVLRDALDLRGLLIEVLHDGVSNLRGRGGGGDA